MINNYIHCKVWDEITYPFPNFNGCTVEVWEWINNFIPLFTGHVITLLIRVSKRGPWYRDEATVYPKKYAHGFVVLCFVVVTQSFIMNSHEVFIHIHQGCFSGTGAIVRLPQCQWSKPGGYGKIGQCITTTKHSKTKTVCIFLGIYCTTCQRFPHVNALVTGGFLSQRASDAEPRCFLYC